MNGCVCLWIPPSSAYARIFIMIIYFGLHWVFLAAHRLALAAASRG